MEKIICELVIPLDKNEEIDYEELNHLLILNKENCVDKLLLFSPLCEGYSFTLEEKNNIINFIKEHSHFKIIIYHHSSYYPGFEKEILKYECNEELLFELDKKIDYSQEELLLIYKKLLKINKRNIYIYLDGTKKEINIFSVKRLARFFSNFKGIFIKNYVNEVAIPSFLLGVFSFSNFKEKIDKGVEEIISPFALIYGKEIKAYIEDLKIGYSSEIGIEYLLFLEKILKNNYSPKVLKYIFQKKGIKGMNVRFPLQNIENSSLLETYFI